jgi:hypothetical protein
VALEASTKDCTSLGDAELAEMADLSTAGQGLEAGLLSKQAEEWVLVTQVFDGTKLRGFVFSTLERIGGTPSVVIGVGCIARTRNRSAVLKALMTEQLHKAIMAFPDEDVVIAARMLAPDSMEALAGISEVRPWPGVRAGGEERAWGRRLAKRYKAKGFDDRTMIAVGDGSNLVLDHESMKATKADEVFKDLKKNGYVIGWGWAMAEFLEGFK